MALQGFQVSATLRPPRPKLEHNGLLARAKADFAILSGMREGGRDVINALNPALDDAIEAPVWNWPNTTFRKNGTIATTPRNIVDTGALKRSKQVKLAHYPGMTNFTIKYTAPHANIVYHGGAIQPYGNRSASTVFIPGRPWVGALLNGTHGFTKFDLTRPYAAAIKKSWPFGFR